MTWIVGEHHSRSHPAEFKLIWKTLHSLLGFAYPPKTTSMSQKNRCWRNLSHLTSQRERGALCCQDQSVYELSRMFTGVQRCSKEWWWYVPCKWEHLVCLIYKYSWNVWQKYYRLYLLCKSVWLVWFDLGWPSGWYLKHCIFDRNYMLAYSVNQTTCFPPFPLKLYTLLF